MSEDLVAPLVALARHNIPTDIQGLLIYGNPLRDIPPGALEAALAASDRVKQLEETLRDYMRVAPAFRVKRVGGDGSPARLEQEFHIALEDRAKALLNGGPNEHG